MNPNNRQRIYRITIIVIIGIVLSACVHTPWTPSVVATAAVQPTANPIPITAAVVIDTEFSRYQYSYKFSGDTFTTFLGSHLRDYAEEIPRKTFRNIVVFPDLAAATGKADIILVPRVVQSDLSTAVGLGNRGLVVVVEWAMKDRNNSRLIRLASISGEVNAVPDKHFHQRLFDDLSVKTMKTFSDWCGNGC